MTPIQTGKERNECVTSQTIHDFYYYTYTSEIVQGVPQNLVFKADEISTEVGIPDKVLVPSGTKVASVERKFDKNLHVTALVTLNASSDSIPLFLLLLLKYLPINITPHVSRGQMLENEK